MACTFREAVTSPSPLVAIGRAGFAPAHTVPAHTVIGVIGSLGRMNASYKRNAFYKSIAMALSFLLSVGQAGVVLGHTVPGGSLGKKKTATDVYSVTCSNEEGGDTPTFRLAARVRDELPSQKPLLNVTIAKDGTTVRVTDKNGDGNRHYSPWAYVDGGNGNYRMIVTKSRKGSQRKSRRGAEIYSVEFHCHGPSSSGFIHTSTDMVITQNQ